MRLGLSYYYVGDLPEAERMYSAFLGIQPAIIQPDWVRYHLEGGDLALHLDLALPRTSADAPMQFGAVVSLTVSNIQQVLETALQHGFRIAGEVQHQPYGKLAEIRDPWCNRLSLIEPQAGEKALQE